MKKIIYICTGNTCRSPMAEMITKDLLAKNNFKHIEVSSRGLSVFGQSPVNPHVETILSRESIDILPHHSTILSEDDFTDETTVLTMTNNHKNLSINRFPAYSEHIYTLSEYVTGSNFDIHDPYGGNINIYKDCFYQLEELIKILVKNLPRL